MKSNTLLAAGLASLLTAAAAFAASTPVPTKVVSPTGLPRSYENATVELTLTVDAAGVPHAITPSSELPAVVADRLLQAVSQWRFEPAYENGHAVPMRVLLPLKLVDEEKSQISATQPQASDAAKRRA